MERVYILIDRSKSMWSPLGASTSRIDATKKLLRVLLEKMLEKGMKPRIYLYVFPASLSSFKKELVASKTLYTHASIDSLQRMLDEELTPRPGSPLYSALEELVREDARRDSAILVITDGETLGMPREEKIDFLKKLAEERGLRIVFVVVNMFTPPSLLPYMSKGFRVETLTPLTLLGEHMLRSFADKLLRAMRD